MSFLAMLRLALLGVAAFLLMTLGAQSADSAPNPPAPLFDSDGSAPPRRLSDSERAAINGAFDGHIKMFGTVSAQVVAHVDQYAAEMVRRKAILRNCASKYALVSAGKAGGPFATFAESRETSVINIGGIDLELDPVRAGGGLIVMSGNKVRQPDAGRELLLALDYVNLYRSGLTKSVQFLLTREGDHLCVPSRVGCRVHDASLTMIRYDIWGSPESPQLRWVGEEKLGAVLVEVVCGSSRRSSDPFFTLPWYEYGVAYLMKLIAVLAGK